LKQAPQAIEAFLRAVNINHALPGSWRMLEGLYRMTGQPDNAAMAAATWRRCESCRRGGDLLKHGDHVEAMRLLARIGIARKVFDDAELLLAAVLELAPGYRAARRNTPAC
jgi:hypothetical protein